MSPDVVVVGGGAAGLLAAWRSARLGAKTLLLEKTERLGTKILISGGGKCNVAHAGRIEDVIRAFRTDEARFLRPSCHRLTNEAIVQLFTSRGLEVMTRPDGRVFPAHQTAKDVVAILESYLADAGVKVLREHPVARVRAEGERILGVLGPWGEVDCPRLVLATGGSSYPKTGSTGDGWPWVRELGHTIVPVRAALAPIYLGVDWPAGWAGVALRDALLKARLAGREIARWHADVLCTHRGVSGPAVLGISRVVAERMSEGEVGLEVDLLPGESFEEVSARFRTWVREHPRRNVSGLLEPVCVERLRPVLLDAAGLEDGPAQRVAHKALNRLVEVVKGWKLGPVRTVPLEKGEVVAGGIALGEVDPHTLRSRVVEGLYLCGEILDIAGPVGGYNLQAAFATGYVAGETAARDALSLS